VSRVLRKLSLGRFESGENVEQDESGKNNRGAIGVEELDPRLAQGDHPKDHQPHRKQLQLMGMPSHRVCIYFLTAPKVTPRKR
jgi:hypothetical protein